MTFNICSSITGSSSTVINSEITHIVADAFYLQVQQVPEIVLTHRCQAKLPTWIILIIDMDDMIDMTCANVAIDNK